MARFKWDSIILFAEQLATAAQLQLPLDRTITAMGSETRDPSWRKVQMRVADSLRGGDSLADSMDAHPAFFPALVRRLVRLGEEGNVLPQMLRRASESLQNARDVQQKLHKVMIYPFLIWTILLVELGVILFFVAPKFSEMMSSSFNLDLLDGFFWRYGPALIILGDALLFYLTWLVISTIGSEVEGGRRVSRFIDLMVTRLPFIGTLHRYSKSAELCETLGVLMQSGHDASRAMEIARDTLQNPALHMGLKEIDDALMAGEANTPRGEATLVPHTTLWMIAASGNDPALGDCLRNLAEHHRRQLDTLTSLVRELIEPVLLLAVAVTAAIMLIALYISLFSMSGNLVNHIGF